MSPNPGGKPKKLEALAAKIGEMDDALRERLEQIAMKGRDIDSLGAIKLLWGYRFGLPRQVFTDENGNGVPIGLIILPADDPTK